MYQPATCSNNSSHKTRSNNITTGMDPDTVMCHPTYGHSCLKKPEENIETASSHRPERSPNKVQL